MIEPKIRNAQITSTMLGIEDHGILTCMLHTSSGSTGQGFGGYGFDRYDEHSKRREGVAWGMEFIRRVLATLEVETWEKLPGTPCRVLADNGKIHAIGHFIKENWFNPEIDLAHMRAKIDA